MLGHYLKTILRQVNRHKIFSAITITGLAVGIACTILITLFVNNELSYDRFHANAGQIYRVTQEFTAPGEQTHVPYVGPNIGTSIKEEIPGVEHVIQLGITAPVMLGFNETYIVPRGAETYYASPEIFDTFSFPLKKGAPTSALKSPYSIVINESLSAHLFGDKDPIGEFLYFNVHGQQRQALQVTGILEPIPANSHLQFEALVSFSTLEHINRNNINWNDQFVSTYIMLEENQQAFRVEGQFENLLTNHFEESVAATRSLFLQPLLDIHLYSRHLDSDRAQTGDLQLVLMLLGIALGIIIMACINFMNLATAQSVDRAREIGIRKSFGAERSQLIKQFLGESVAFALISLFIGLIIVELALPYYNNFIGKSLFISYDRVWFFLLGFASLIGILSGAYPAFFLSLFRPINTLKGKQTPRVKRFGLRRSLVIAQFSIAIVLFISVGIVYQQLDYIQNKDMGFEKERILYTVIPSGSPGGNDLFKQELLQYSNITRVGRAVVRPLYNVKSDFPSTPTLAEVNGEMLQPETALRWLEVGHDFLETFEMKLLAGRTFSEDRITDETEAFLLNETAVKAIGWSLPEEAIGKEFHYDGQKGTIIGVLKDFNFESLHSNILPFVIRYNRFSPMVFVKIEPENIPTTISYIQQTWEKYSTSKEPFHYQFMDEIYNIHYTPERNLQSILTVFALLSIFINCLGVLGLTMFTVQQRKREIGIRKVLGASSKSLITLLSKEMVLLYAAANIFAWPVSYLAMKPWLENFAYRSQPGVVIFIVGALLVGLITFATMSYLSYKASQTNPIETIYNS